VRCAFGQRAFTRSSSRRASPPQCPQRRGGKAAAMALDILIAGKYRLGRKLGGGSFGEIFLGTNLQTGEEVGIKLVSAPRAHAARTGQAARQERPHRRQGGSCHAAGACRPCSSGCHAMCRSSAAVAFRVVQNLKDWPWSAGCPPEPHCRSLSRPATRSCCMSPNSTKSCRAEVRAAAPHHSGAHARGQGQIAAAAAAAARPAAGIANGGCWGGGRGAVAPPAWQRQGPGFTRCGAAVVFCATPASPTHLARPSDPPPAPQPVSPT
jgi:hypothetical protein